MSSYDVNCQAIVEEKIFNFEKTYICFKLVQNLTNFHSFQETARNIITVPVYLELMTTGLEACAKIQVPVIENRR